MGDGGGVVRWLQGVVAVALVALAVALVVRFTPWRPAWNAGPSQAVVDSLGHRADSVRVVYQRDTVTLRRLVTRVDSLLTHDTVTVAGATVTRLDTVRLRELIHDTVKVREVVVALDTALRVCRLTVLTCGDALSAERAKGTALAAQRDAVAQALTAAQRRQWVERAGWAALTVVLVLKR